MSDKELDKIIEEIDDSINHHLKGNDHYFYHLAKVNKQTAVAIIALIKTIKDSDKQSERLEMSNYRLQRAMLILTAIGTMIVAYPVVLNLVKFITPYLGKLLDFNYKQVPYIDLLASMLSAIIGVLLSTFMNKVANKNIEEEIKLKDSLEVILRDKEGKINEVRQSK